MEALTMGDYGPYVWSCFGLTLFVLIICAVQARARHRSVIRDIRARLTTMESKQ